MSPCLCFFEVPTLSPAHKSVHAERFAFRFAQIDVFVRPRQLGNFCKGPSIGHFMLRDLSYFIRAALSSTDRSSQMKASQSNPKNLDSSNTLPITLNLQSLFMVETNQLIQSRPRVVSRIKTITKADTHFKLGCWLHILNHGLIK